MKRTRKQPAHDDLNGADGQTTVLTPTGAGLDPSAARTEALTSPQPQWESLTPPPAPAPTPAGYDDAYAGAAMVDSSVASYAAWSQPGEEPDDSELIGGLNGTASALPDVGAGTGWARDLRRIGRAGVWALPLAAIGLAVSALWGWPQPAVPSARAGTWLVLTLASLALLVIGSVSVTALVAATPGRRWATFGAAAIIVGAVLFAPVLGVIGLARPAVTNATARIAKEAAALQGNLVDGTVARWLTVGSLVLLAAGLLAVGVAVLASEALTRVDGYLLFIAVGTAVIATWRSWPVLLVISSMVLLAACLGVAWTASRLTPGGRNPEYD